MTSENNSLGCASCDKAVKGIFKKIPQFLCSPCSRFVTTCQNCKDQYRHSADGPCLECLSDQSHLCEKCGGPLKKCDITGQICCPKHAYETEVCRVTGETRVVESVVVTTSSSVFDSTIKKVHDEIDAEVAAETKNFYPLDLLVVLSAARV